MQATVKNRSMSLEKFLKDLSLFSEYFRWNKNFDMFIPIRGYHKTTGRYFCPITAMALMLSGNCYGSQHWKAIGKALGLSRIDSEDIAKAADGEYFDGYDEIRAKLTKAIGVKNG